MPTQRRILNSLNIVLRNLYMSVFNLEFKFIDVRPTPSPATNGWVVMEPVIVIGTMLNAGFSAIDLL